MTTAKASDGLGCLVILLASVPVLRGVSIVALLKHHYDYGSVKMLAAAQKVAPPAQRQALSMA